MVKYAKLIEYYSDSYAEVLANEEVRAEWNNKEKVIAYLDRYYLPREEYENTWKSKQETVFMDIKKWLPNIMFKPDYMIHPKRGGCLFMEEDFLAFQKGLQNIGEEYFIVIEHESWQCPHYEERLNFRFPVSISWHDMLTSGVYISSSLCNESYNGYFLFGENSGWGMYAENDYDAPLVLLGVKPQYKDAFTDYYNLPEPEKEEIFTEWVPKEYQGKVTLI